MQVEDVLKIRITKIFFIEKLLLISAKEINNWKNVGQKQMFRQKVNKVIIEI